MDHNATSPLCDSAWEAMSPWLRGPANASSVHTEGRAARNAVENAREQLAQAVGARRPKELLFTSGATEANNLVLAGGGHLVTTAAEHPSVLEPARAAGATIVGVDGEGRVNMGALKEALALKPRICSVLWANNETGVLQDLPAIAALCREAGVLCHMDACQALGRIPIDVMALGVDAATFSAHKVQGPVGVGALWVRTGVPVQPLVRGGHQERGRRPGTESVAAIVGFGAAAANVPERLEMQPGVAALRDALWAGLDARGGVHCHGMGAPRLSNTLNVGFEGVDGHLLLMGLDLAGVSVSAGSACTVGSLEPSHVLLAMGLSESAARSALRFSLGPEHRERDVEQVLGVLDECLRRAA